MFSVSSARQCPATEASVALLKMGSGSHLCLLSPVQVLVAQQGWHLGGRWELPQTALTAFKGTSRNRSSHPAAPHGLAASECRVSPLCTSQGGCGLAAWYLGDENLLGP